MRSKRDETPEVNYCCGSWVSSAVPVGGAVPVGVGPSKLPNKTVQGMWADSVEGTWVSTARLAS